MEATSPLTPLHSGEGIGRGELSMAYETILYDVADEVATVTLNRPAKMNEIGRASCRERVLVAV